MNTRIPFLFVAALFSFACKSSSAPPVAPVPELPVVRRDAPLSASQPPSATAPRSAIAALPRPDLVMPPVAGGRIDQPITIGGAGSATSSTPPRAAVDAGFRDLEFKLVMRDGERSKDSHSRTHTVELRAGHLVSVTSTAGRQASATPPVRREGNLSADEFAKIVSVIEAQRLAESESNVTDITRPGRYVEVTLDVEWRSKKTSIKIAGMTRLMGSEAKTEFAEHPLSKRVAVLVTTLRRIIAGY